MSNLCIAFNLNSEQMSFLIYMVLKLLKKNKCQYNVSRYKHVEWEHTGGNLNWKLDDTEQHMTLKCHWPVAGYPSRDLVGCPSLQAQVDIAPKAANLGQVSRIPGQLTLIHLEPFNRFSFMSSQLHSSFASLVHIQSVKKTDPADREWHIRSSLLWKSALNTLHHWHVPI